jgi:hypothetical protein
MTAAAIKDPKMPMSWAVAEWTERAPHIWPNETAAARQLVRAHRTELLHAGAIARVGRALIIIGPRYAKFLELQTSRVPGYVIAPNRSNGA